MAIADDILTPQQRHVEQLRLQPAPAPVQQPRVVDRVAYLQEQTQARRQAESEAQQSADLLRRIQAIQSPEFQQGINQMFQQGADIVGGNIGTQSALAIARQHAREFGILDSDDPRAKYLRGLLDTDPEQYLTAVGEPGLIPGQVPGVGIGGAVANVHRAATQDIPLAKQAQQAVGEAARFVGNRPLGTLGGGVIPAEQSAKAHEAVAEAAIPTDWYGFAFDLLPGVGTIPGARSAISRVLKEGGYDLTAAGVRKFLAAEGVQGAMKKILAATQSESGALRMARQAEDLGGPAGREITDIPKPVVEKLAIKRRVPTIDAWNALPQEDRQLIEALADSIPTKAERRTALEAQHMRQGAKAEAAFTSGEGTTVERAQQAFKQMGGKQAQRFEPVAHRFDGPQIDSYFSRIDDAVATKKIGAQFEGPRATSALHLLFYGTRLPNVVSEAALPLNLMPKEIELLGRIFGPEFEAVLPRTAEELSKFQLAIDVLNAPRALITALDFSAAGRQGIVLAARNPKEWAASWKPMIEAMGSPKGFDRVATELRSSPYWDDALYHNLDITDIGGGSTAEEFFINRITEKIPGVQMSERGFTMFLDYLRMKTYEKYAGRLERTATKWNWTPQRLDEAKRQMAAFLNHATGRGDLKSVSSFIPALNAVFFSPRYLASRVQTIWDLVKPGVDPAVRQIAAENVGAFMATGTAALGLLAATGAATVEMDSRSSDFGKVKIGDQRIEFWGGFQPLARFAAQTAMGERKELFTGDFVKTYRGETVLRFIRSKLSPGGSLAYDLLVNRGRTFEGDKRFFVDPSPKTAWNEFQRTIFPLWVQDMIEAYQTQGLGAGATAGAVSAIGGGVGTFSASEDQQQDIAKAEFDKKLEAANFPTAEYAWSTGNYWKDQFQDAYRNDEFSIDPAKYDTFKEFKSGWIDYWAEKHPEMSETEARARLDTQFEAKPTVKLLRDKLKEAELRFWREHPDLLQEAIAAGREGPGKAKDEILQDAGLR